jgi:hypothetical protein
VSERSVRNYCAQGRVNGAFLTGKTWTIPETAEKPERTNKRKEQPQTLLDILQDEKKNKYSGGIYHKTQIDLTYNSKRHWKIFWNSMSSLKKFTRSRTVMVVSVD